MAGTRNRFGERPNFTGDPLDAVVSPAPATAGAEPAPTKRPKAAKGEGTKIGTTKGKVKFSADVNPNLLEELRDTASALRMTMGEFIELSVEAALKKVRADHFGGERAPSRHERPPVRL